MRQRRGDERGTVREAFFLRRTENNNRDRMANTRIKDEHKISSLEVELNRLVEQAFALTDSERLLLVSSLPPRDPIQVLEAR